IARAAITARRSKVNGALLVVAAGFVVAQAARVHPTAWVPAALVPLVALVAPGPPARRIRETIAAAVIIAVVVAITSAPALLRVAFGQVGSKWMPVMNDQALRSLPGALAWLGLA